jgi:hypothetical protein
MGCFFLWKTLTNMVVLETISVTSGPNLVLDPPIKDI